MKSFLIPLMLLLIFTHTDNLIFVSDKESPFIKFEIDTVANKFKSTQHYGSMQFYTTMGNIKKLKYNVFVLNDIIQYFNLPLTIKEEFDSSIKNTKIIVNIVIDKKEDQFLKHDIKVIINDKFAIPYKGNPIYFNGIIKKIYLSAFSKNGYRTKIFIPNKTSNKITLTFKSKSVYFYYYPMQNDTIEISGNEKMLYLPTEDKRRISLGKIEFVKITSEELNKFEYLKDNFTEKDYR